MRAVIVRLAMSITVTVSWRPMPPPVGTYAWPFANVTLRGRFDPVATLGTTPATVFVVVSISATDWSLRAA